MASNTLDTARGGQPGKPAENGKADPKAEAAPAPAGKGLKAWIPLGIAVVTMPALAFATTHFVLLPQLAKAMAKGNPAAAAAPDAATSATPAAPGEKPASDKNKVTYPLSKLLVNVAGTLGTRYLMTSITLVGNIPDFKDKIEANKDQLMDLATGTLSGKTISDLEKPGARNVIRAELLTVFNNALGGPLVQEIYITELAIQ